jgi:hypothetical protein
MSAKAAFKRLVIVAPSKQPGAGLAQEGSTGLIQPVRKHYGLAE